MPAGRPPEPAKFNTTVPGSCLVSTRVYMTSRPISNCGAGFQIVRTPAFHTLKSGLQPGTCEPAAPVSGVFGAARLRIGLCGEEQNNVVAVSLKSAAV